MYTVHEITLSLLLSGSSPPSQKGWSSLPAGYYSPPGVTRRIINDEKARLWSYSPGQFCVKWKYKNMLLGGIVLYTFIFESGKIIFMLCVANLLQVLRGWVTPHLPLSRSHSLQSVKI